MVNILLISIATRQRLWSRLTGNNMAVHGKRNMIKIGMLISKDWGIELLGFQLGKFAGVWTVFV